METNGEYEKLVVDCGDFFCVHGCNWQIIVKQSLRSELKPGCVWFFQVSTVNMNDHHPLWIIFFNVGGDYCGLVIGFYRGVRKLKWFRSINLAGMLEMTECVVVFPHEQESPDGTETVLKSILSCSEAIAIYWDFRWLSSSTVFRSCNGLNQPQLDQFITNRVSGFSIMFGKETKAIGIIVP